MKRQLARRDDEFAPTALHSTVITDHLASIHAELLDALAAGDLGVSTTRSTDWGG